MSRMEMAVRLPPLHTIWLIRATNQENRVLYNALANASLASSAWSMLSGVNSRSFLAS
jgi:hypothetical protein